MNWDYIVVGGGSAGCVLADRLSENPANRVLLLEAGPEDRHPLIHMPRGSGNLFRNPRYVWHLRTEASGDIPEETWIRGKVLGGSSSINGMMYFRGQPQDYDHWEALGAKGWGWDEVGPCFRAMERHALGGDEVRGADGPLGVSVETQKTALTEAYIAAGEQVGLKRVEDLNRPEQGGIGYVSRTIWKGRRQSTAQSFLKRARHRANLTVVTDALVDCVILDGTRAIGVKALVGGVSTEFRTDGEVILSAGALMSPQILQRSGIGPGALLQSLGIAVARDHPGVGRHMLEHRLMMVQYDLKRPSENRNLRGLRLYANALRYGLFRSGPLAAGYGTVGAFAKVLAESATPDIEILFTPLVALPNAKGRYQPEPGESVQIFGYPLRSRSEGTIEITSREIAAPAKIRPGYLTDPYDQRVTVAMHRFIRRLMAQPALASFVASERDNSRQLETDEEILDAFRKRGNAGYHACGTCRMGDFDDAVLDPRLRVLGIDGLRVVDGSIMPTMVSANTNAPIMASAWRAADLILHGRNR